MNESLISNFPEIKGAFKESYIKRAQELKDGPELKVFGGADTSRRLLAKDGDLTVNGKEFKEYRKTTTTYAVRVDEPFEVSTLEGVMRANAGDYLALGSHGELYPIAARVFESTYESVE